MIDVQRFAQLLSTVDPEARDVLLSEAQTFLFPPDTVIYSQGDLVDGVYIVAEGLIKERAFVEGKLQLVRLTGPGELLGAGELLSEPLQAMSAITLRETRLCYLEQAYLQEMFKQYPEVLLWLMKNFARQLSELRSAIVETVYVESSSRLAHRLIEVAERFGKCTAQGLVIDLALSRDEWAALVGMAPETVSRILHGLERRGWIALEGRQIRLIEEGKLRSSRE